MVMKGEKLYFYSSIKLSRNVHMFTYNIHQGKGSWYILTRQYFWYNMNGTKIQRRKLLQISRQPMENFSVPSSTSFMLMTLLTTLISVTRSFFIHSFLRKLPHNKKQRSNWLKKSLSSNNQVLDYMEKLSYKIHVFLWIKSPSTCFFGRHATSDLRRQILRIFSQKKNPLSLGSTNKS